MSERQHKTQRGSPGRGPKWLTAQRAFVVGIGRLRICATYQWRVLWLILYRGLNALVSEKFHHTPHQPLLFDVEIRKPRWCLHEPTRQRHGASGMARPNRFPDVTTQIHLFKHPVGCAINAGTNLLRDLFTHARDEDRQWLIVALW